MMPQYDEGIEQGRGGDGTADDCIGWVVLRGVDAVVGGIGGRGTNFQPGVSGCGCGEILKADSSTISGSVATESRARSAKALLRLRT